MVKCPDPSCRESLLKEINDKLNNVKKCVVDEMKDIAGSLSNRPKTRTLLIAISIFVTIAIAAGTWIYAGYSNAQDRQNERLTKHTHFREESREKVIRLQEDVKKIKEDIGMIKLQTGRSENVQIEMLKILKRMNDSEND